MENKERWYLTWSFEFKLTWWSFGIAYEDEVKTLFIEIGPLHFSIFWELEEVENEE